MTGPASAAPLPSPSPEHLGRLAEYAVRLVRQAARSGLVRVGLGSGRAAEAFVRALAGLVRDGAALSGVPTSAATAALARSLGIPLADLGPEPLDLTVDGADEVDPALDLIKGYGGALVRERIVAAASRRQIILVTPEKLVPRLGTRGRLPVEIVPFAHALCTRELLALGARPRLREAGGQPLVTDNGNWILDCGIEPLADAAAYARAVRAIPGVVDTGLFLGTADTVVVAEPGGIDERRRG
jgi:ribose 5-phosphate isomerase A